MLRTLGAAVRVLSTKSWNLAMPGEATVVCPTTDIILNQFVDS